jgi:hypothetical protein
MKKRIGITLLTALLAFNSCDDKNVDLKPLKPSEENYYTNEQEMNEGLIGVYSKLVFLYNYRANNWLHDVRLLPDDNLTTTGGNPFETFSGISSGTSKIGDYYTFLYQVIGRANSMLGIIDKRGTEAYKETALRNYHRGEALFLRSFANFQLWNYWGGAAPLVTERVLETTQFYPESSNPGNPAGTMLLDQVITDLTEATNLLPEKSYWAGKKQEGRATVGAARALLGKALLFRGTVTKNTADYAAAVQQFNQITGYSLVKFGDNFEVEKENNDESLFEIQHGRAALGNNSWLNTDEFGDIGDLSGFWGFFDGHWAVFGMPNFVATEPLKKAFPADDPRRSITLEDNGNVKKYVPTPWWGYKGVDNASYYNNARVIRYADVLLMKAEALLFSGGSNAEAVALINQVRARARQAGEEESEAPLDRDVTVTDPNTVFQWIMEERRLELAFEEAHRWFDLRRWHLGGQINLQNWDFGSVRSDFKFDPKNLFLPIPGGERQLNPNLKQNPGY